MEWFDIILKIVFPIVAAALAAYLQPFFAKRKAERKAAETVAAAEAERDVALAEAAEAKAENDLTEKMQAAVQAAEIAHQAFDAVAKQNGNSLGAMKRESVLNKLQAYALSKGYTFDEERWGAAIDAYVATTKVVNAIGTLKR